MSVTEWTIRKMSNKEHNIKKLCAVYKRGMSVICALVISHIYTTEAFAKAASSGSDPSRSSIMNLGDPGINLAGYTGLNNFGTISENMTNSSSALPGLITAFSYLCGILLGCLAIVKLKDHVENPKQVPLKTAGVMMAVGGAFMALPIVYESMFTSIGDTNNAPLGANLSSVSFFVGN